MTNEQINLAVLEATGWRQKSSHMGLATVWVDPSGNKQENFPDYCNDLNATHEAEEILASEEQCSIFARELAILVKGFAHDPFLGVSSYIWHATARQRAEAFLRTIGKWEEGEWEEIGKVETFGKVEKIGKREESK